MIFVLGNTVGTIHDDFPLLVEQALVFGLLVALGVCDGRDLKLVHLPSVSSPVRRNLVAAMCKFSVIVAHAN